MVSNEYCTICNSNCKSIHACKLFMLSPSLPTHPFYSTCLEFVGCMQVFFYVQILHSVVSLLQRNRKFRLVRVNSTHQVRKADRTVWGALTQAWAWGRSGHFRFQLWTRFNWHELHFPSSQKEHWHYGQLFPIMLCPYAVFSDSLSLKLSSETPSTFDALKSQSDYSSCGCLSTINSTHRLFTDWLMTAGSGLYRRKLIQIKFQRSCHNVKFFVLFIFLAGNKIF